MWYSLHNTNPKTCLDVLNESLWNNASILIGNRPSYNKKWKVKGIIQLRHIMNGKHFLAKDQIETKFYVECQTLF